MIIAFDPVAKDLTLDFEDGLPPIDLRAEKLLIKHYGQEGIFFAEASAPDEVEVGYLPAFDVRVALIQVTPGPGASWQVRVVVPA